MGRAATAFQNVGVNAGSIELPKTKEELKGSQMNKYGVCFQSDFEISNSDDEFYYLNENDDGFVFVEVNSKEEAARWFLRYFYDAREDQYAIDSDNYCIMRSFIEYGMENEDIIDSFENSEMIKELFFKIDEEKIEEQFKNEGIEIFYPAWSYSSPSKKCIDLMMKRYPPKTLISLLSDEELFELYFIENVGSLHIFTLASIPASEEQSI